MSSPVSVSFAARKKKILEDLVSEVPDASPKGFIDANILPLVNRLNGRDGIVTTSSCSGRVAIFLEGAKKSCASADLKDEPPADDRPKVAGVGVQGEGGRWIFVSHDPVDIRHIPHSTESDHRLENPLLRHIYADGIDSDIQVGVGDPEDVNEETRFVYFKFEPMILHVATSEISLAHTVLKAAFASGFRESGIMNPGSSRHPAIMAIRTTGLALDNIIGKYNPKEKKLYHFLNEASLRLLFNVANLRFKENRRRMALLASQIELAFGHKEVPIQTWEDKDMRRERKKAEGLRKKLDIERLKKSGKEDQEPSEKANH